MPFSITTRDGITINNIPDDVAPDSPELKRRVAEIRAQGGQAPAAAPTAQGQIEAPPGITQEAVAAPEGGAFAGLPEGLKNAALEFVAGVNRGVVSLVDIPAEIANAVLELSGAEARVPKLGAQEIVQAGTKGGFLEPGLARQVAGTLGEFASPAPPIAALARGRTGLAAADDLLKASTADEIANVFTSQSATKQKIAQKLAEDPANKNLVKFVKDGAGRIAKDKTAIETIRQGFDEGVIAAVKGASKRDRRKMQGMMDILKRGRENALFASKNRPSDIAGQSMLERLNFVKQVNRESGKAVDDAAKALKGQRVDLSEPTSAFADALDELGVKLAGDGKGGFKPNFDDAVLAPGDRGPIKEVIRQMSRLGRQGVPDANTAHQLKKIIDRNVTFGKTKTGLSGDAERVLKDFRRSINQTLGDTFPSYRKPNQTFSETIEALDSFQSGAGGNVDLFGPNADKAIGTVLRRLLSNTQSRVTLIDAIDDLETVARKTGGKFEDDVLTQVLFSDELASQFGSAARTSLAGETQKAVTRAAELSGQRGITQRAIDVAGAAAERVRGVNPENAIKSIEELLKR